MFPFQALPSELHQPGPQRLPGVREDPRGAAGARAGKAAQLGAWGGDHQAFPGDFREICHGI